MTSPASSADPVLDKLERAIRWSNGFTLLFVKSNHRDQRDQMRRALLERLAGNRILEIVLDQPVISLLDEIARQWDTANPPGAVSVVGLENAINEQGEASPVLGRLNHDRDLLRRAVPVALLLWLPDFALDCVARGAPDFWAWRSGVYEFETDRALWQAQSQSVWSTEDAATASLAIGDKRKEIARLEELLRTARSLPQPDHRSKQTVVALLNRLAILHLSVGNAHKAATILEEALATAREIGDRRGEGNALGNLGIAHFSSGDARKAIEFCEQALKIEREIGNPRGEGATAFNSALALDQLGDRVQAITRAEAALRIFEAIEDPNAAQVRARLAEWRAAQQPPSPGAT